MNEAHAARVEEILSIVEVYASAQVIHAGMNRMDASVLCAQAAMCGNATEAIISIRMMIRDPAARNNFFIATGARDAWAKWDGAARWHCLVTALWDLFEWTTTIPIPTKPPWGRSSS